MIDPELIIKAQSVPIVDYLASKGFEPVNAVGKELVYFSPLREEKNASFYVNPAKNRFHDFTNDEHKGNVIRLAQLLEGINFPQAVTGLLTFKGSTVEFSAKPPFFSATTPEKTTYQSGAAFSQLQNPSLINYLNERAIPYSLGKKYLHEVMTTAKGRNYYNVGFKNDSNGFALRNKHFKGCEGVQDITTFDLANHRKAVAVFEGFFDFLSALVWFGLETPRVPTVVLNSTGNRTKAVSFLSQFEKVNCFLDRDKTGKECFERMIRVDKLNAVDCSGIYEGYNDFNEFLVKVDL
jgi:DNA primase